LGEPIVQNLSAAAKLMGAGIHQRHVFQLLVNTANDWINHQQPAIQVLATLTHEFIGVLQEFANSNHSIVLNAIGPQSVVIGVPVCQQFDNRQEEFVVLHAEGNLFQVQPLQVSSPQKSHDLLIGPVLR